MLSLRRWQSGTAILLSLGIISAVTTPVVVVSTSTPVLAQSQVSIATIPAGTVIPLRSDDAKKILVTPTETSPLTLMVRSDIRAPLGAILIPAGSEVKGQLQPAGNGQQFIVSQIILPGSKVLTPDAKSQVVTRTESIRRGVKPTSIAIGTVAGAGAATALSAIFGGGARGIKAWRVLAGAGTGAVAGTLIGLRKVTLISVDPNADLDVTLQSSLTITYP